MSSTETYVGPDYNPPRILRSMGTLLKAPRKWHSTDISYIFSSDSELQHDYVDGLLVAGMVLFSFFLTWAFILIVLKVKGKEVGCASGRAFHTEKIEEDMQSTDSSESYSMPSVDSSSRENDVDLVNDRGSKNLSQHDCSFEDECDESRDYDSEDGWLSAGGIPLRTNLRETRTRSCFLFVSFLSLLCVPFILMFSFGPMKEAARDSDDILLLIDDSIGQVTASLGTIESAASAAGKLVQEIPLDTVEICPLVHEENFETELGIDLNVLLGTVSSRFTEVEGFVADILLVVENMITRVSEGVDGFEESAEKTERMLWIIPGILFAVSMVVAIATLGVLLAWKNKSGARIQSILSYGVLPLLMVASAACWIVAIAASFGTMTSSDFCTSGLRTGSPDDTIQEILSMFDRGTNDTLYQFIDAYTNRCMGPSPVAEINGIETMTQDTIDVIWRQLSIVDKIGRAELIEQCGGGTSLADLFTGSRNLAKLLTTIRKSLDSAGASLECQRINSIYTQFAHGSVCTSAASATAFGFLLFLILGIATMILISLRASWLQNVEEEKVYHDEEEIAENMILDEHEEYLAYISRYKHEWQEYHGFEATSVVPSNAPSFRDEESEGSYFDDMSREESRSDDDNSFGGSDQGSDATSEESDGPAGLDVEIFSSSFHTRSIHDGARSSAIDEISFQSLSAHRSEESLGISIREEELFAGPSPLLPPTDNADFREDAPDEILIPSTEVILKESRIKKMNSASSRSDRSYGSKKPSTQSKSQAARPELGLKIDTSNSASTYHGRPDTPAAVAVGARSRTSTWTEGEGSSKMEGSNAVIDTTSDEGGQLRSRTSTWTGESSTIRGKASRNTARSEVNEDRILKNRTSTWGGEGSTIQRIASVITAKSSVDDDGQLRSRTSSWGGGDTIQRIASAIGFMTAESEPERRHSFGAKKAIASDPANQPRVSKQSERTELPRSRKNRQPQTEKGSENGLVEL